MDRKSLHVLFIEDSADDVELAVRELKRDGFKVSWDRVDTESQLRTYLRTAIPDVVLSDYSMPGFDGNVALRVVSEICPQVPFIFLSGTIGEELAIQSIREGATDYVLKGNMRRLSTAVGRALSDAAERARTIAAERARERLAAILEATSDCVAICDPEGRLIYLNSAGRKLTSLTDRDIGETNILSMHPDESRALISGEGWPHAMREGLWHGETTLRSADGGEIPMSQVIIAHRRADGELEYYSTIARDIRDRKAYEERIAYLANYDALTGLPNRSLLGDRTAQAAAYRRGQGRPLALLVIDIDRFKLVNDGYGQTVGDELLRQFGRRLVGAVREGDTVARLGADSFGILATSVAHAEDILVVAREVQAATTAPFVLHGREIRVTVAIGASVFTRDGTEFDALLRNADAAMHRAKTAGHEGFQFYAESMTREATERVDLENALRSALERKELSLHFQPQVLLESRRIVGLEALMRWRQPQRGWVPPDVFIPIAEHSDLINEIGGWALAQACRQMTRWAGLTAGVRVAVNVSARQFRSPGFANTVTAALETSGVDPGSLELELTERVLVEDQVDAARVLKRLKEIGVRIAVDDFGTGYSSLSYLSRMSIDCLKIDRAFLQHIPGERHDTAIVEAIISLARSLGLNVIAEGIETEDQLRFLQSRGCTEGQGYFLAKPAAPAVIEPMLTAQGRT